MSVMYATVTSKGQVTLPAELRRALGIEPGQTVSFSVSDDHAIMEVPPSVEDVRAMLEGSARRNGTWGKVSDISSAWREAAVKRYEDA